MPIIYNLMVVDQLMDDEVDRIFGALADTTRRDILSRAIRQEQSVSALAGRYEMSFAAVQKHVAVLERATLVTKQRHGREQIVHANTSTLRRAVALLDAYEQLWIAAGRTDRRHPRRRERRQPMTVISSTKDPAALTLTVVAEFDVAPGRVWEVWEDPRKLERWWGPPTFPATFTRHDFVVGGESRYYMTGPAGETPQGWWRMDAIDKPHRLEFANGLAGDDGEPAPGVEPMPGYVTFEAVDGGTRMTAVVQLRRRRPDGDDARHGDAGRHEPGDGPDRRPLVAGSGLTGAHFATVPLSPPSADGNRVQHEMEEGVGSGLRAQ